MNPLLRRAVCLICLLPALMVVVSRAQEPASLPETAAPASLPAVMKAADLAKILPSTVFFRGLSAPIQARNSGGVQFADKRLMMAMLVDTSGYSTSVQEKYQAYLITEVPIDIGGHLLHPGAYGCGFIAGDTFIVQDLGAHDLFTAPSTRDAALRRPTPLQVIAAPEAGSFRLYAGRSYITFRSAAGQP